MFKTEDFLTRLQNGESADAIAKQFTEALNSAVQEQKEQEKNRKMQNLKLADAQVMVDGILDFFDKWYPDLCVKEAEVDAADVLDTFDKMLPEIKALTELSQRVSDLVKTPAKTSTVVVNDPFKLFFKRYNL